MLFLDDVYIYIYIYDVFRCVGTYDVLHDIDIDIHDDTDIDSHDDIDIDSHDDHTDIDIDLLILTLIFTMI